VTTPRRVTDARAPAGAGWPDAPAQQPEPPRLEVTGTQVLASGLASVSAAIVASVFGVAGTVIGAAVVSVVFTLGSAVYGFSIRRTKAKLEQSHGIRLPRPTRPRGGTGHTREAGKADGTGNGASPGPLSSTPHGSGSAPGAGWRAWLSRRRWGVTAGVAIVLVSSLAVVTLIELVGQQPLSSMIGRDPSGRTSIGSLLDDGDDAPGEPTTTTTAPDVSPTTDPDATPQEPAPTTAPPRGAPPPAAPGERTTTTAPTTTALAPQAPAAPDDATDE
jgi:hypothetical protein